MANLRNGIPLPGTRTVEYCAGGGVGDILKGSSNPELGDTPAVNSLPPGEGTAYVFHLKTIIVGRGLPHSCVAVLHWEEKAENGGGRG